jgi:hypothetical protein
VDASEIASELESASDKNPKNKDKSKDYRKIYIEFRAIHFFTINQLELQNAAYKDSDSASKKDAYKRFNNN